MSTVNKFAHWAAEMDRAASAVEAESDGSQQTMAIIDGNRAIAQVLRDAEQIEACLIDLMAFGGACGMSSKAHLMNALSKASALLGMERIHERQGRLFAEGEG